MPYFGKIEWMWKPHKVDISKCRHLKEKYVTPRRLISYRHSWLCLHICAVLPNLPSSYQVLQQALCMPIHTGEPRKSCGLQCEHSFSRTVCWVDAGHAMEEHVLECSITRLLGALRLPQRWMMSMKPQNKAWKDGVERGCGSRWTEVPVEGWLMKHKWGLPVVTFWGSTRGQWFSFYILSALS